MDGRITKIQEVIQAKENQVKENNQIKKSAHGIHAGIINIRYSIRAIIFAIVYEPKSGRKEIYGKLRKYTGKILRKL